MNKKVNSILCRYMKTEHVMLGDLISKLIKDGIDVLIFIFAVILISPLIITAYILDIENTIVRKLIECIAAICILVFVRFWIIDRNVEMILNNAFSVGYTYLMPYLTPENAVLIIAAAVIGSILIALIGYLNNIEIAHCTRK